MHPSLENVMRYYDILIMPGSGNIEVGKDIHEYLIENVSGYEGGVCVSHKVRTGVTVHYMLQTTEKYTKRNKLWEPFKEKIVDFVMNLTNLDCKVMPITKPESFYNTLKSYDKPMIKYGDMDIEDQ